MVCPGIVVLVTKSTKSNGESSNPAILVVCTNPQKKKIDLVCSTD